MSFRQNQDAFLKKYQQIIKLVTHTIPTPKLIIIKIEKHL